MFNIDNSRVPADKIIFRALILSGEHFLAGRIFENSLEILLQRQLGPKRFFRGALGAQAEAPRAAWGPGIPG